MCVKYKELIIRIRHTGFSERVKESVNVSKELISLGMWKSLGSEMKGRMGREAQEDHTMW